ncbi:MAG: 2-oxoacid:acceptor oxidoreductase subunit alpha [Nitrososphaerota archaeon]|nr:2-oxoacid:acceptor oxidoreductase subunit alpha [Nitrososphaerota archaeon]
MSSTDLMWVTGGPQGSGIDTAANLFARAVAKAGYYVYGKREYHSNIKGKHSYFETRVSRDKTSSCMDAEDILTAYDSETIFQHFMQVKKGGVIIYNTHNDAEDIEHIISLENALKERLSEFFHKRGMKGTTKDAIDVAKENGALVYGFNMEGEVAVLAKKLGEAQLGRFNRYVNTLAVALSTSILGLSKAHIQNAAGDMFGGKGSALQENIDVIDLAYELTSDLPKYRVTLTDVPYSGHRVLLDGNTVVALGKLAGGLRFQSYYPITPASDESVYLDMNKNVRLTDSTIDGPAIVQTEDEIAAIAMANGAALTGARSSTATSGPGFSLMVEGLGFAGMIEIPVVITYYMRGGPSTGLPTRNSQADLLFALSAGHGDFPKIVLSSGDHIEAFYDAIRSLNYAERYQMPVIHLVDKALANAYAVIDESELNTSKVKIERGTILNNREDNYKRFRLTENGVSPRATIGSGNIYWATGDEHDELGHITEDPYERDSMYEKRMKKLVTADKEIPESERFSYFGDERASHIIVSWGSNKGAILKAMHTLKEEGIDVGFLHLRMFSPFPKGISRYLTGKKLIDIESNYRGQCAYLLRAELGITADNLILKYNGRPPSDNEVYSAVKDIIVHGTKKVVLTNGV